MSTTYLKPATIPQVIRPSQTRRNLFGLAGAAAGVAAFGGALAILLAPAPAVVLPAMDASLGYHDVIDSRPAISALESSFGYADVIDTGPAISTLESSLGYWDVVDARPAVSVYESMVVVEGPQGYQVMPRTAVSPVRAPTSADFVRAAIATLESSFDNVMPGTAVAPVAVPTNDSFFVIEGPQGYEVRTRSSAQPANGLDFGPGRGDLGSETLSWYYID